MSVHLLICFMCAFVFGLGVKHYLNFPSQKINIIKIKKISSPRLLLRTMGTLLWLQPGLESDLFGLESWLYDLLDT